MEPKNPGRVPWLSQVLDPVGTAPGGGGVTVGQASPVVPGPAAPSEEAETVTNNLRAIPEDGIYEDGQGNRVQFRKGHPLTAEQLKRLTRVDDFAVAEGPAAEFAQTVAPADEGDGKAAAEPENKKAPSPGTKKD
jgi:hypothetical protein